MGQNRNTGADNTNIVYGNPESFRQIIKNHGQLCKIRQMLPCPCVGSNHNAPSDDCELCHGDGMIYTHQRRFLIADEDSLCNRKATEIYPYYYPILEVTKVERLTSEKQGGISEMAVKSFDEKTIYVENDKNDVKEYEQKRVTYFFDGWTKVENETLKTDATNGLMWTTGTFYDAKYQSSNPLKAEADITDIIQIKNTKTGYVFAKSDYKMMGNLIKTTAQIDDGYMKMDYYFSDLTQVITADLKTKDVLEKWTNDLSSGDIRCAVFPWWNISKGDLIVIAADAQYKNQLFTHTSDYDKMKEVEVFELNDVMIDENGNKYYREVDYTLVGFRFIHWISKNQPKKGAIMSIKYGFKPTFICFEDNPEPNNLENRRYPKIIYVKEFTKTSKDEINRLMNIGN